MIFVEIDFHCQRLRLPLMKIASMNHFAESRTRAMFTNIQEKLFGEEEKLSRVHAFHAKRDAGMLKTSERVKVRRSIKHFPTAKRFKGRPAAVLLSFRWDCSHAKINFNAHRANICIVEKTNKQEKVLIEHYSEALNVFVSTLKRSWMREWRQLLSGLKFLSSSGSFICNESSGRAGNEKLRNKTHNLCCTLSFASALLI